MQNKKTKTETQKKIQKHKITEVVLASLAESLFIKGLLNEDDFEDKQILRGKIHEILTKSKNGINLHIVVDHQESVLNEADRYFHESKYDLAYVFYATYFEHLINDVIELKCSMENISNSTYRNLVRHTSLEDKFTWVTEILKLPKFSSSHWKTVKIVGDRRNNFIHYKYQPAHEDIDYEKGEWGKIEKALRAAVAYSKAYRTRILYAGKAKKLRLKRPNIGREQ